jgi:hypothetical protein
VRGLLLLFVIACHHDMLSNDKNLSLLLCKAERLRGLVEELIADIRVSPGDTVDKKLCDLLGPSLALLGKMLIKGMYDRVSLFFPAILFDGRK